MMNRCLHPFLLCFFFLFLHCQSSAASLEKIEVFVSIPPQKWLCEQVGKGLVNTQVLIDKGQEPHTFEPRPRQILELSSASIFFGTGMVFERTLIQRMGYDFAHFKAIDTTAEIRKIPVQGAKNHDGELDPHVWLSPKNLKIMAASMARAFTVGNPEHGKEFKDNLAELNTLLDGLDREIAARLAPFQGAPFLVFHPAFGYFAHEYHLQQVAVEVGGRSPTPKKLAALISMARKEKIRVIFVQPQFDRKSANVVATAIGGTVVPMDPLAENVADNLRTMSEKIAEGLKE